MLFQIVVKKEKNPRWIDVRWLETANCFTIVLNIQLWQVEIIFGIHVVNISNMFL